MSEYEVLRDTWGTAAERHQTHRPRLYRGADGIYRCPECDPPGLWALPVERLRLAVDGHAYRRRQKNRVKRRRR
ncbi:hypothetical protein RVR_8298 [Actinacidiphila reveromycinica]|uniref:Uncharacterized protein n=1 Tax=Actinacidiphila reveromycinica TaxID=659352 RepID=A0A7U3UYS2_9ACTN|nr:hypothetical protein [Streptomyces sp. SN-593]BBB01059.1 hypothetical protein RVR_8298 [Streptomyces sp. SN-593]